VCDSGIVSVVPDRDYVDGGSSVVVTLAYLPYNSSTGYTLHFTPSSGANNSVPSDEVMVVNATIVAENQLSASIPESSNGRKGTFELSVKFQGRSSMEF
jgi:hypothetical protein